MTTFRALGVAVVLAGGVAAGALGFPAVGHADAVPPALLNTTCSLDQIMAATKAVDPIAYGAIVDKYATESPFIQGEVVRHLNLLLEKSPEQREAEVDELARIFPDYVGLFRTAEPTADAVVAQCPTFPADDPSVWNAAPASPPVVTGPGPVIPQPATAATPAA